MPSKRRRPSSRRERAKAMVRSAIHPNDRLDAILTSRKCQTGRHAECGQCGCPCHNTPQEDQQP